MGKCNGANDLEFGADTEIPMVASSIHRAASTRLDNGRILDTSLRFFDGIRMMELIDLCWERALSMQACGEKIRGRRVKVYALDYNMIHSIMR
jgi:hypothetical protein